MRQLDEMVLDIPDLIRPLLSEAYEAGRKMGYQEASVALKAKLFGVLTDDPDRPMPLVERQPTAETSHVPDQEPDSEGAPPDVMPKRATPGSVKPAILRLLTDAWDGQSVDAIVSATGFKHNSVRGTLWTLGNEGSAIKRHGKWFIATSHDAIVEETTHEPVKKIQTETEIDWNDPQ